jgi:hypothetical protein
MVNYSTDLDRAQVGEKVMQQKSKSWKYNPTVLRIVILVGFFAYHLVKASSKNSAFHSFTGKRFRHCLWFR